MMSVDAKKDTFQAHPVEDVERALDLAISRSLCELMGMDLVAQSTLSEGSTFTITIPESLVVREGLARAEDVPPNAGD